MVQVSYCTQDTKYMYMYVDACHACIQKQIIRYKYTQGQQHPTLTNCIQQALANAVTRARWHTCNKHIDGRTLARWNSRQASSNDTRRMQAPTHCRFVLTKWSSPACQEWRLQPWLAAYDDTHLIEGGDQLISRRVTSWIA